MNVGDDKGKILLQEMDKLPAPPKAVLVRHYGCCCAMPFLCQKMTRYMLLNLAHERVTRSRVVVLSICCQLLDLALEAAARPFWLLICDNMLSVGVVCT
jgi:hypothetical protein